MFKVYYDCTFPGSNSFNWIPLLALVVSIASILCSLYFIYLTKRVELLSGKFQKFCIAHLDQILKPLDDKFNSSKYNITKARKNITDVSTDLQLFVSSLRQIYPKIDLNDIIADLELFTDTVYSAKNNTSLYDLKPDYLRFKLSIYSKLYDFALNEELNLIHRLAVRLGLKKKSKPKLNQIL